MEYSPIIHYIAKIHEKANKLLVSELAKSGLKGIVPSHGGILIALFFKGELSMKEIAEFIGKDKSTVTALTSKLINYGYVKKEKSATDSRSTIIELTPKGLNTKQDFDAITKTLYSKIDNGLTKNEKQQLHTLLEKLNTNW